MTDVDRCLICGEAIPEGAQVCKSCMAQYHIEAGEAVEIAEEMRDIAGVLSITKETEPKYLPKVVLARLKTATTLDEVRQQLKGQGFTRNEMKAMIRSMGFFDGLEVFLSKWNWDNYASWHLRTHKLKCWKCCRRK